MSNVIIEIIVRNMINWTNVKTAGNVLSEINVITVTKERNVTNSVIETNMTHVITATHRTKGQTF